MESYAYFIGSCMGHALVVIIGLLCWLIIFSPFYGVYRAVSKMWRPLFHKKDRHESATRM